MTSACGGTSLVTVEPAATIEYGPMVTPQTMVALAPIEAPRRTSVGTTCQSVLKARGVSSLVKAMCGPRNTSSSTVTPW